MFGNFLGYSEKHYFLSKDCYNSFFGIVWKIWATFYSNIWSHLQTDVARKKFANKFELQKAVDCGMQDCEKFSFLSRNTSLPIFVSILSLISGLRLFNRLSFFHSNILLPFLLTVFKKIIIRGLFLFYFRLFNQTLQFLQQLDVKKGPSSKRCWDLNPWPSKH